jgi:hypothetical protein
MVVEGTPLTAGLAHGCPAVPIFGVGGPTVQDASNLTACINSVPGYTANRTIRRIKIIREAFGDVPDSTVSEDMANVSEIVAEHVNGSVAGLWGPNNVPAAGIEAIGGAGGIVIDNISGLPGASRVYFANIGPLTGNATQASQSDLD